MATPKSGTLRLKKRVKDGLRQLQPALKKKLVANKKTEPGVVKSKSLPFDEETPGDRGDCEKRSLTQGSE